MEVENKWTGKVWVVKEKRDGKVALVKDDGSEIWIEESEFNFSYRVPLSGMKKN